MSDTVAARLLDSQDKVADGGRVLRLPSSTRRCKRQIWSEGGGRAETTTCAATCQREHLRRVAKRCSGRPQPGRGCGEPVA